MGRGPPGSSVHGIFQTIILEGVAISFGRGSSQPGTEPSPALAGEFLILGPPGKPVTRVSLALPPPPKDAENQCFENYLV